MACFSSAFSAVLAIAAAVLVLFCLLYLFIAIVWMFTEFACYLAEQKAEKERRRIEPESAPKKQPNR